MEIDQNHPQKAGFFAPESGEGHIFLVFKFKNNRKPLLNKGFSMLIDCNSFALQLHIHANLSVIYFFLYVGGDFVFSHLSNSYSDPEKVLLTLYQVGAMSQADLTKILGWEEYHTSRVIKALNSGKNTTKRNEAVKIDEIREYLGVRGSGKIRTLTRSGLDLAGSITGLPYSRPPLKEGEARLAAVLAKFAAVYENFETLTYYGPHLVPSRYQIDNLLIGPTAFLEATDDSTHIVWLAWINEAMSKLTIQCHLEAWRRIFLGLPMQDAGRLHGLLAVCPTENVAQSVSEQAQEINHIRLSVTSFENLDPEVIYSFRG